MTFSDVCRKNLPVHPLIGAIRQHISGVLTEHKHLIIGKLHQVILPLVSDSYSYVVYLILADFFSSVYGFFCLGWTYVSPCHIFLPVWMLLHFLSAVYLPLS